MKQKYPEYKQLKLTEIAKDIQEAWQADDTFQKSISNREGNPPFVFYEGPPSANGMPGIHHVISRTLKDLVCRYKTMKGFQVKRKGGWDTHGLPVELGVEKLLGITKEDIGKSISVEEYNATCRREVLKYKDKWDEVTQKMGYWVDLEHPYITFENDYIETLWWCLKELYKKGYLYESVSIQPYSPAAGTGLSSHELNQPGTYKDVKDTSATVMFALSNPSKGGEKEHPAITKIFSAIKEFSEVPSLGEDLGEVFFLAWTTTPWTLPSNLGLTVGPNIDYSLVKTFNPYTHLPINVILATVLISNYFKAEGENGSFADYKEDDKLIPWQKIAIFKGNELEGLSYQQLMPFEANSPERIEEITPGAQPFKVVLGDFVTTEDGTGIVHTAPAFGADDFKIGKKNNLGILILVDKEGKFIDGVGEFSGRYVKDYKDDPRYTDVNVDIAVKLKKENRAFKVEKYEHNYPHCWRTDKPVIYYPLDAWFIKTTAVKDRMIELNKSINWKPASTGTGRFGNWLENMVDWNLSRSRFWGTPLPVWRTEDDTEEKCIGSIDELKSEIKKSFDAGFILLENDTNIESQIDKMVSDLHKPYVDNIILVSSEGKPMKRVPDLIDVWFDSGAMPYAQWHFPFENKEQFEKNFPADFIAEGVDQTRGWFYTLHALAVLLFDSVAYKTVVSNGLVLDKNGNKMSKRVGNVVDPFETLEVFGPDAARWYLITNASPWDNLKFDTEGIKEVQRKFFGTLFNTYQFFALYANVDGFNFGKQPIPVHERPELDQWILSSLNSLIKEVNSAFNDYEPTQAGRAIEYFLDAHLSNWYVRLSRRRFWKPVSANNPEGENDKISAYQTLYYCLEVLSGLMAPIAPFFADWLFNNLNSVTKKNTECSVHLTNFPVYREIDINLPLEDRMQLAQDISSLILSLRKKVNIKVRQPLQKVIIPAVDADFEKKIRLVENIIKSETNIKEVEILESGNNFIKKKAKANFKTLGKRLGAKMKVVAKAVENLDDASINNIQQGNFMLKLDENETVAISSEDIEVSTNEIPGFEIAVKGSLTVALDLQMTDTLKKEGFAREFINRIQNLRKENDFELTDKILLKVQEKEGLKDIITEFNEYICAEILADSIEYSPEILNGIKIDVNNDTFTVKISKKSY
ncbi:isoleucine--tRNA ligase [Hanamia caeni]|uniref:Isoleucine--tRNA ligase n=1 Tax=Hanamia caeni TaxID=2294116 RepID=A0A3M9N9Q5_9BACT|nr:isoleucine--tRNA ligase [Hanamia caeni]RNI34476.1 isoleucine--tRNA ligase [Hanamia caeni]